MKPSVLDKFSKLGKLRTRLDDIVARVGRRETARMDAGDLIGSHIVANLAALARRSPEESRLLFDAQRARAQFYHDSKGATALEAAESLCEARAALREIGDPAADLGALGPLARGVLDDLFAIGSRRNAWIVFQVLFDAMRADPDAAGAAELVSAYADLSSKLLGEGFEASVVEVLLDLCDWTRRHEESSFSRLVQSLPQLLSDHLRELPAATALRGYLYARHLCVGISAELHEAIVRHVAGHEQRDQEARSLYGEFLSSHADRAAAVEEVLAAAAYVNPDTDLAADADLEALNHLLSDVYPEAGWVWRNRALLFRRRRDPVAALACLARAMEITGEPPEVMGLLTPVLAGMGFVRTAFQFSRFLSGPERTRFHLDVLDLLAAEPKTAIGAERLLARLTDCAKRPDLPREFAVPILDRRARLALECGSDLVARECFAELVARDPADELSILGLSSIDIRRGEAAAARLALSGRFSARAAPHAEFQRSLLAEQDGDLATALRHAERAAAAIAAAQEAGRDAKIKAMIVVRERTIRMHGAATGDGALMAMLQLETHVTRHDDLLRLEPVLQRRVVELSLAAGQTEAARDLIQDIVEKDGGDTAILVQGARASLRSGRLDEAAEYLATAKRSMHDGSAEMELLRALLAASHDDHEAAREHLERSVSRAPTAEARLLRAGLLVAEGDEAGALEVLATLPKEEGGTPEIRHNVHDLAGRLLERAERKAEALERYLAAEREFSGWTEARRRAGLLSVELGLTDDGDVADGMLLARGADFLDGYNDPDSVTHAALARAALIDDPKAAAELLRASLTRTAGACWHRLQARRVELLLEAGARGEARAVLEEMSVENPPKELVGEIRTALADLVRADAFDAGRGARIEDSEVVDRVIDDLRIAETMSPSKVMTVAISVIERVCGRTRDEIVLPKRSPRGLALAAALTGCDRRGARKPVQSERRVPESGEDLHGKVARLLAAVGDPTATATDLLAAMDVFSAQGSMLPYRESELLVFAAARAVSTDDGYGLRAVLERGGQELEGYRHFERLRDIANGVCDEDASRVLNVLDDLVRSVGGDAPQDTDLARIRAGITAVRERRSPAWASARLRTAGKRTRCHVPSVLAFWTAQLADDPTGVAAHHVALMQIAAAHESESAGIDAAELFDAANIGWERLLSHEGFWRARHDELTATFGAQAEGVVAAVRASIAEWLVDAQLKQVKRRVHGGDLSNAIELARVVVRSPLAARLGAGRVRDGVFTALSGDLERLVQQKRYEDALQRIDHVIVADPENPVARREMVRVCARGVAPALAVMDALTTPPDASMIQDTGELLARLLVVAASAIDATTEVAVTDPTFADDLALCLRAQAWLAWRRDGNARAGARFADRAIDVLQRQRRESPALKRFRSDIGLAAVADSMSSETAAESTAGAANPLEAALAEVDRLIELDPRNAKAIAQKTRLLLALGRDEDAEAMARDLFEDSRRRSDPSAVRSAIELMHQIGKGRERLRYDSRIEMIDRLRAEGNWRAALDLLKDAIVGRESEPHHIILEIEILLGLHKLDRACRLLEQLADCAEAVAEHRRLAARCDALAHVTAAGGDLLAAWELVERGQFDRAASIAKDLTTDPAAAASAHLLLTWAARAKGDVDAAKRHAREALTRGPKLDWLPVLLEGEKP